MICRFCLSRRIPIAEIRRPEFVDTVEDLSRDDQDELTADLVERSSVADPDVAPAVCHLDSGVRRSHALLSSSLDPTDVHSLVGDAGGDHLGHGTLMAGLALYGPLDDLLTSNGQVVLTHRLESVKVLPDAPAVNDPLAYGLGHSSSRGSYPGTKASVLYASDCTARGSSR